MSRIPEWDENTERRVGILESKMDKLLDPETGIYSKLSGIESRLQRWAIAILGAILVSLIVQLVTSA